MKDDPREVDWAERHVKGLTRHFEILEGRVARLESQTEFETSEDDARLVNHSRRLDRYENQWSQTVTELKAGIKSLSILQGNTDRDWLNQVMGLSTKIDELMNRMRGLDHRIDWAQAASAEADARIEKRLDALDGGGGVTPHSKQFLGVEDQYSPPVGGRKYERDLDDEVDGIPDVHGRGGLRSALDEHLEGRSRDHAVEAERIVGAAAMRKEQYDRGMSTGVTRGIKLALDNAANRVRTMLTQDGHDPAVIEAIVWAIRNDGGRLPQREAFQVGVAMVSGTPAKPDLPCPGEMHCWAAEKDVKHTHDHVGVVHYVK